VNIRFLFGKKVIVYALSAFLFFITTSAVLTYYQDSQPTITLQGIENNQVIQSPNVKLFGKFKPNNFTVSINGEKIKSTHGNFVYNYPLKLGKNKIIIRVAHLKSVEKEITLIRELSPEEIVRREAEKKKIAEQQKQTKKLVLVTRVIDGDTVELPDGNKVRLIGIDTPEKGECYFSEAKDKLSDLILNKKVRLEKDVSETDRYHRLLRYIYVDDIFVNDYLVAKGYAHATSYPPDVKFQDQFRKSEKQAREQNKGLWGVCSSSTATPTKRPIKTIPNTVPTATQVRSNQPSKGYVCDCSKTCAKISSCAEAYYQLNTCGCSRRDGDHDGIPCEKICH